jgi:HAMP domain-containing protein
MRLVVKFNLVLLVIFVLGFAAAAAVSASLLERSAREDVLQDARLIMESALATRAYTINQVAPLLKKLGDNEFLPQTVPAFAATEQFETLHAKLQDFSYKEATLNPTNPRDRSTDWEVDIVNSFRQSPERTEIVGERETPLGRFLYLGRPIVIRDAACLSCHSTVETAPKSMIQKYGPANGFGWRLNETVGAQLVSVPMTLPIGRADRALYTFLAFLGGIFLSVFVALNVMLRWIVVRRLATLSRLADEVSLGKIDGPDFPSSGHDEVSGLAQSFNRMKKSVAHAIKMLEE